MATAAPAPQRAEYLPPSRRFLAGAVLAGSNLMVVLDLTIANVSIPNIAGNLGITLEQGAWVITSYAVCEAICVPLTGWLSERFGAVRVFMTAMFGFGLFSLLCGLSPTLGMLVACRIGQGLCGAPLMPISQALMTRIFPPEQRPLALATWVMTVMVGPALGPIVGGAISDAWSWHWIFLINVPLAVLCTMGGFTLLRPVETPTRKLPIDKIGFALLVFWVGSLQLMLDIGRDHDWFADPQIVVLAIMAGVGFLAFVIWELTEEHPIVDLRIFGNRSYSAGVSALAFSFAAYFAGIVIIPQWLQTSMGYPAINAGMITAVTSMTSMITSPIAGKLMGKVDARIMISGGLGWCALMMLWRTQWNSDLGFWQLILPQLFMGFGLSFFMVPLTSLTIGVMPPDKVASAAGLQNFIRTMGIAIATSLVLSVLGDGERVAQNEIVSKLNPNETTTALARIGMNLEQSRAFIASIVSREALMVSVTHVFWISGMVCLGAALLVWLSPKPPKAAAPMMDH